MFYLIGVDHRVQAKSNGSELSEEQRQFCECLENAIKETKPALVAEEYSAQALEICARRTGLEHESVTQQVARSFGIEHRFCDPDSDARKEMEYVDHQEIRITL